MLYIELKKLRTKKLYYSMKSDELYKLKTVITNDTVLKVMFDQQFYH